jgi:hypothetical protein
LRDCPSVTVIIGEAGENGKNVLVFVIRSGLASDCPEKNTICKLENVRFVKVFKGVPGGNINV